MLTDIKTVARLVKELNRAQALATDLAESLDTAQIAEVMEEDHTDELRAAFRSLEEKLNDLKMCDLFPTE